MLQWSSIKLFFKATHHKLAIRYSIKPHDGWGAKETNDVGRSKEGTGQA